MTNIQIRGIPADRIEQFWPHAKAFVKRALDHANGELSDEDIHQYLLSKDMQLWVVAGKTGVVAVAITRIFLYPNKKRVRVMTLAGKNFDDWIGELSNVLNVFTKEVGADGIEAFCRRGLARKLEPWGFKRRYEVVYRPGHEIVH